MDYISLYIHSDYYVPTLNLSLVPYNFFTYTFAANSATWEGRSALKEFWPLNLENKNQDDQVLLLKLLKLLTVCIYLIGTAHNVENVVENWLFYKL